MINHIMGFVSDIMSKRTAVILDDDVFEILVQESLRRFGNTRSISKVLNDLIREAIRLRGLLKILELTRKKKYASISEEEFEEFRRDLSKSFEDR